MDIVRSLVRVDALEIRHVPHRRVLGQNAIGAEEAAGFARDIGGNVAVVPLRERDLLRRELSGILEPAEVQRHELRLHDLGEHDREALLLQLEAADRLVEHHAARGIRERLLVAGHRGADHAPRDAVARLRETHQRALDPAALRQDRVLRQMHILEYELTRI